MKRLRGWIGALLLLLCGWVYAQSVGSGVQTAPASTANSATDITVAVPRLSAHVTDLAGMLPAQTRAELEARLVALEQRKGAQVAVLLVPTIGSDTIETFAVRVFERWKLGRKKVDDGVLLVVAQQERKMRIEVGYGLEGAIPDVLAKRIIQEQIRPRFAQGDFAGGVLAGVDGLETLINGEALPEPPPRTAKGHSDQFNTGEDSFLTALVFAVIAGMFVSMTMGKILGFVVSSVGGAVIGANITGSLLLGLGVGAASAVVTLLLLVGGFIGGGGGRSYGRSFGGGLGGMGGLGGGFGGGGFGGGGFGGGGGDSGGFGGGGGGSGGGGASGGW